MSAGGIDLSNPSPELFAILATTPLIPPPPGKKSNFAHPESRANELVVTSSIFLVFVVAFSCNRVYVKLRLKKKVNWDDGTLMVAFLLTIVYYATGIVGAKHGTGQHFWDINLLQATKSNFLIVSS
jgi:hypothetical protein